MRGVAARRSVPIFALPCTIPILSPERLMPNNDHTCSIGAMREAGRLAAAVLKHIATFVQCGITTRELDNECRRFIAGELQANAACLAVGFPGAACISVNHVVCHGIPGDKSLKERRQAGRQAAARWVDCRHCRSFAVRAMGTHGAGHGPGSRDPDRCLIVEPWSPVTTSCCRLPHLGGGRGRVPDIIVNPSLSLI